MAVIEQEIDSARKMGVENKEISIAEIKPSALNPRKVFEESALQELAESIKAHGILEPIVARYIGLNYEIIAGERRWRAAQLAGLEYVPVRILHDVDDRTALEMALTENLARRDIDPIEEAEGLKALQDMGVKTTEIAKKINRDPATISNSIRLLKLPEPIQEHIRKGDISASHGKALIPYVEYPKILQAKLNQSLNGVPSKEVEKFDFSWKLADDGAIVIVRTNDVGIEAAKECTKCDHRRKYEGRDGWLCLKPECYESKKAERTQQLVAEVKEALNIPEGKQLPTFNDLGHGNYESLAHDIPTGCKDDCEHRGIALNWQNKPEPICLDPKCHRRLKMATGREQGKIKRDQNREAMADAVAALDAGGLDEEMIILACWHNIKSAYMEPLREAIEHLQLPVTVKDIVDSWDGKSKMECWDTLLKLGTATVLRLSAELRIRQEIHNAIRNGYSNHEDTDWLLKRFEARKAEGTASPVLNTAGQDNPTWTIYERDTADSRIELIFVSQGLGDGDDQWMTVYKSLSGGSHRIKSLPLRDTRAEAQADLDAYAQKKKWNRYGEIDADGNMLPDHMKKYHSETPETEPEPQPKAMHGKTRIVIASSTAKADCSKCTAIMPDGCHIPADGNCEHFTTEESASE
jgi:ParB/RepB/Spo0J family partition protein